MLTLLVCALTLVLLPGVARSAQDHGTFGQQRLIHRFDFDERDEGNFESLPMYWYPIGRPADNIDPSFLRQPLHQQMAALPGFPSYGDVRFDNTQKTSGQMSFYLGLNGGSVGSYLAVGAVPAVPGSDYLVTAQVRTTALRFAQAQVTAYLVDNRGQRIDASRVSVVVSPSADAWQAVSLKLLGDYPQAAWIGLQLELLQPEPTQDSPLGKHQLVLREVHGSAWFDDIAIWQSPSVTIGTQSPVNVLRDPQRPRLAMEVRDLTGRALEAQVAVYDHRLALVSQMRTIVGDGHPTQWQWAPPLPSYGWYLVDLQVHERDPSLAQSQAVARSLGAVLWLPPVEALPLEDQFAFGLSAEGLPDAELKLLPTLLDALGVHRVTISAWDRSGEREALDRRQSLLDQVLQPVLLAGRQVVISLAPVPQTLQRTLDVDDGSVLPLFNHPTSEWAAYVAPVVMRHGQRVSLWQMGGSQRPASFHLSRLDALAQVADDTFHKLAPQPTLVVPWSLDQGRRPDASPHFVYAMTVPATISPSRLVDAMAPWRQSPAPQVRLHLQPWDADLLDHPRRVADLAQRMVHGWESGAHGLDMAAPWSTQLSRRTALLPDPLLGVFRQVAQRLAGRRVVGRLHVADGVECLILSGSAGGALVAWNRWAQPEDAVFDMYLGPDPVAYDVWGNRAPLAQRDGKHQLQLSQTPIFIEGIDPELALFRAAFKVEPRFLESLQIPHDRHITLFNPWQRTISGHMLVLEPEHWQISPRKHYFSIAAGQSYQLPLTLMFPPSEVAGLKLLRVRFDFLAHHRYEVELTTPMDLGLRDVDFNATLSQEVDPKSGTHDAVVTQLITNHGQKDLALYAFAAMPGFPAQQRIVAQLRPGQSIVRRFRFSGGAEQIMTSAVRVGLRQTDGPAVLNRVLRMNQP